MSRVTVTNPFDLLADENEDRTNVPAPKKEQKPASAPAKPAAKPAAATGAAAAKPAAPKSDAVKAPAAATAKSTSTHSANQVVKPAPPRDANTNLLEREKESRAPNDKRDGPRNQVKVADGKRANDRKSGTGIPKNEEKKKGAGKGNWGEAEAKEGAEVLKDEKADDKEETEEEKVTVVEGEKKEGDAPKEGAAAEPPKEEVTRTLEEYLAEKKKSTLKVEAFKPRTVSDDEFKGFVALERGESGIPPLGAKDKKEKKPKAEGAAKPTDAEKKEKKDKKEKNLAAQLLTFSTHQDQKRASYRERNYEDRRGSGDSKPQGRGRGGPKGAYNRNAGPTSPGGLSQPPVDQEKDFPSLSPHGSDPVKA